MKLLVVISYASRKHFERVAGSVAEDTIFCDYQQALEQLLVGEPTHVLFDIDNVMMEGHEVEAQETLRDLRLSAAADQKVFVTSFMRREDVSGDLGAKDFLRKPYSAEQLAAFLSGAG